MPTLAGRSVGNVQPTGQPVARKIPLMNADGFLSYRDKPELLESWLNGLGVRDPRRAGRDLLDLIDHAGPGRMELIGRIAVQLDTVLPRCPEPGMALANLEQFVAGQPDPEPALCKLAENIKTTEILLHVFSTSQYLSEVLIRDPGLLGWLQAGAERPDREALIEDLWSSLSGASTEAHQALAIRRFRLRETLRIGYNDIVRGLPLEVITLDLSNLADACTEAATRLARWWAEARFGPALRTDGSPARFVVLGLGKLGGTELNYSSDIDLVFLYDEDGRTSGPRVVSNAEFFARMGAEIVRLLTEHTARGVAYRVDMRLRPDGEQGALARSLDATLGYYETRGRTWERQALIKCRPVAGDLGLGRTFVEAVTPFIYRRYLGASEISEIKALKRRIEQRTVSAGAPILRSRRATVEFATSSSWSSFCSCCTAASIPRSAAPIPCWPFTSSNRSVASPPMNEASWMTPIAFFGGSSTGSRFFSTARLTRCPGAWKSCGRWRSGWATCRLDRAKTGPSPRTASWQTIAARPR